MRAILERRSSSSLRRGVCRKGLCGSRLAGTHVVGDGSSHSKGERRRYALVTRAAELLCESGFEAVRHRAVARRAGLPLASTTYYFSSLDDLITSAVRPYRNAEVAQLRAQVATLSRRRRGPETTADLLVDLLVGSESGPRLTEQLISRYERYIACARQPALRDIQRRNLHHRVDAIAEVNRAVGDARCAWSWSQR